MGSLNTVLLCGRIPKCFCVCARGRSTILNYSRPHTPEVAPRLLCLFKQLDKLGGRKGEKWSSRVRTARGQGLKLFAEQQ